MSDAAVFDVRVVPRSARTCFAGRRGAAVLVRLAAPPVDGAANEALIEFLARSFQCARARVEIVSGGKSREKRVRISGMSGETLASRLALLNP